MGCKVQFSPWPMLASRPRQRPLFRNCSKLLFERSLENLTTARFGKHRQKVDNFRRFVSGNFTFYKIDQLCCVGRLIRLENHSSYNNLTPVGVRLAKDSTFQNTR